MPDWCQNKGNYRDMEAIDRAFITAEVNQFIIVKKHYEDTGVP
jgi:hypothetical protein